jgi:RNA polymerase sigma factor (sigma-70 family)
MTWLITIVRRRSIDEYRRLERTDRIIDPAGIDHPEASGPDEAVIFSDSARALFGADVMGRLESCFAQLSADQRRAITDIRVRGMTYEEAAQFYKVPRQTVAARVRRGIESLTECMRS